ncbi:MAG: DUF1684 domain-containing protein [Elusimicrobiota bacterium]
MDIKKWKNKIKFIRRQKDSFFKSARSPLSFEDREDFEGLNHFPPTIQFRFKIELSEHSQKNNLKIKDTKGNIRNFLRYGEFIFNVNNIECKLQTYKSDKEDESLFIPFKDKTSGQETYPAGRYLDLDSENDRLPDGKWILDFNFAYNPWCAYSDNYACPLTPSENYLDVKIQAGEKMFKSREEVNSDV